MPPIKKLSRSEATRLRVLTKAIEHVRHSGPAGLSVEQVSKEVGVTRQTTYNHFATKQDLLFVIARHESERQASELSQSLQDTLESDSASDPSALIADGILMLVELAHSDPAVGLLLTADTALEALDANALKDAVAEVMRVFWEPVLDRVAATGNLTSSVERTITWLTFIHFLMVTKPGSVPEKLSGLRREITRYVTPGVLRGSPGAVSR